MAKTTRRHLTDDERAQRRAQDRERLEQAAQELLTSDGWQRWVKVRACNGLARYSAANTWLIAMQCPHARFVAGFRAWLDLDRCVRKGERGIRILAPVPIRQRDEHETDAGDAGEKARVKTLFKSIAVFDVSQTDVLPGRTAVALEPPSQAIIGDSHAHLLGPLTQFAGELGYRVDTHELGGSAGGWCDTGQKLIVVNAGLPANARVRVLVHELAHALGIGYTELGRERAEVMVDCVTFIVLGQVGLSTAGESIPYVAGWGEDGALDAIQAYAREIDDVARRLHDAIATTDSEDARAGEDAERVAA